MDIIQYFCQYITLITLKHRREYMKKNNKTESKYNGFDRGSDYWIFFLLLNISDSLLN